MRSRRVSTEAARVALPRAFRYRLRTMGIANAQNLVRSVPVLPRPYGIRVRLRPGDPFAKLLGSEAGEPDGQTVAEDGEERVRGDRGGCFYFRHMFAY